MSFKTIQNLINPHESSNAAQAMADAKRLLAFRTDRAGFLNV